MGKHLDLIAPIAGAILGSTILPGIGFGISGLGGGAIGAGLGSGGYNYSQTHNIGDALKAGGLSAGGSYLGANLGGALLGDTLGTVGGAVDAGLGAGASSDIASALGSRAGQFLGTSVGQLAGSSAGNSLASSFAPQGKPSMAGQYPYLATQQNASAAPKSLNSLSSLTQGQQSSGLATQGLYGGGLGPDEQGYYANLINRQLTNPTGHGTNPLSSLSPVEQSYNSKLGFGNEPDTTSLLGALHKWKPEYA